MMESTYSVSSFEGLVSSNRRLHLPPNSAARPKLMWIDLAWPICRYPLGSGGNRMCTRPPHLLVFKSSRIISRMKWEGPAAAASDSVALMSGKSGFDVFMSLVRSSILESPCRSASSWYPGQEPPAFQIAAEHFCGRTQPHEWAGTSD